MINISQGIFFSKVSLIILCFTLEITFPNYEMNLCVRMTFHHSLIYLTLFTVVYGPSEWFQYRPVCDVLPFLERHCNNCIFTQSLPSI